jgi:quaternary ammonium compound-resistance protein SugE
MNDSQKGWCILVAAGMCEIVWAVAMGRSNKLTDPMYDAILIVFLTASTILLEKAVDRGIPVGTAYAVWTGIGAVGTLVVSAATGMEHVSLLTAFFVAIVIAGIVGLQMTSGQKRTT